MVAKLSKYRSLIYKGDHRNARLSVHFSLSALRNVILYFHLKDPGFMDLKTVLYLYNIVWLRISFLHVEVFPQKGDLTNPCYETSGEPKSDFKNFIFQYSS